MKYLKIVLSVCLVSVWVYGGSARHVVPLSKTRFSVEDHNGKVRVVDLNGSGIEDLKQSGYKETQDTPTYIKTYFRTLKRPISNEVR